MALLVVKAIMDYLKDAQKTVRGISGRFHKKTVKDPAWFYTLLIQQVGQPADRFVKRSPPNNNRIGEDLADVIVGTLAFMNWLGVDANSAFEKSLRKHRKYMQGFT